MLKICSETLQKPRRSSPKRPNNPRTRQKSQKLPPKLRKFTRSLPKVAPSFPKGSKKISKSCQKAPRKVPRNEAWTEPRTGDPLFLRMSLKHSACHAFRAIKKTVLAREREARFNFQKCLGKCKSRRSNKETLQSMCKALPPPTSPPTQATAFANIAQHWLDKYKKNKKIIENS